jgi:hypothetical protein
VTRGESLAFAMLAASLITLVWAAVVVVALPHVRLLTAIGVPMLIAAVALATALAPANLLEGSGIAAWMILSREKGSIRRLDHWLVLSAVVFAAVSVFRIGRPHGPAVLCMLLEAAVGMLLLLGQECVCLNRKRWSVAIPEWLKGRLKVKEEDDSPEPERGVVIPPDDGAKPLYHFKAAEGQAYAVGVMIPDELIAALRRLNREHRGYLYQQEPQAVVLADRPPTESLGREQVERLCAQVLSIARKHQLSRLALANAVLAFVQTEIPYGFDRDSTAGFEGGPFEEYGRMPPECLHDSVGDCECTSILCTSLLAYLGFETALLSVVVNSGNHMAVGLLPDSVLLPGERLDGLDLVSAKDSGGKRYLYGETALDGCNLPFGAIPADWRDSLKVEKVMAIGLPRPATQKAEA